MQSYGLYEGRSSFDFVQQSSKGFDGGFQFFHVRTAQEQGLSEAAVREMQSIQTEEKTTCEGSLLQSVANCDTQGLATSDFDAPVMVKFMSSTAPCGT